VVCAGSTPTALASAGGEVTEERPGTFVFGDRQQHALGAHPAESIALYLAATVVSTTVAGQFVLDAGAKVLTKDLPPTVDGYGAIPAFPLAVIRRLFDHHALVDACGGPRPQVGERVAIIPNHACPVVNTVDQLHVTSDGVLVDHWPVAARGRNT
jgi:D-serine deaminase-like pyridoxal phosphate-dependent protein